MKKIISVVGARPNFMKMASIHRALMDEKARATHVVVHTGQHFSAEMSEEIFNDLNLPKPNHQLNISGGSGLSQVGRSIEALEKIFLSEAPDLVLVYGDVNSTVAGAICASRLQILLAHVEAGLRSFDKSMPEEVNRIITDSVSNIAFVTEVSGQENLLREGWSPNRIHLVGNTMIDSLVHILEKNAASSKSDSTHGSFLLVTLHRPSNVDSAEALGNLLKAIGGLSSEYKIIFPIHPRTKNAIESFGLSHHLKSLTVTDPLRYSEFVSLVKKSKGVITDSGGIQEETTYLGIPCITLRENTERPITLSEGTNHLISPAEKDLSEKIKQALNQKKKHSVPKFWDGAAGKRIVEVCLKL